MEFKTFYHGTMGPQELSCLVSFIKNGHEVSVYAYDRDTVPPYLNWKDAAEILPREMLFYEHDAEHKGTVGAFSDVFRWELLSRQGGIWIDTDIFCISPDWPEQDIFFAWQDENLINGAVMKFPAGHELPLEAAAFSKKRGPTARWGEVGPELLTSLVHKYGLENLALNPMSFYPAQYWWAGNIRNEVVPSNKIDFFRSEGSVCIHLWNECLRQQKIDKSVLPKASSTMDLLLTEYNLKSFYQKSSNNKEVERLQGILKEILRLASKEEER